MNIYVIKNECLEDGKYKTTLHKGHYDKVEAWKEIMLTVNAMLDQFVGCGNAEHKVYVENGKVGVQSTDGTFYDVWSVEEIECDGISVGNDPKLEKWRKGKKTCSKDTIVLVESYYERESDGEFCEERVYDTFFDDNAWLNDNGIHLINEQNLGEVWEHVIGHGKRIVVV